MTQQVSFSGPWLPTLPHAQYINLSHRNSLVTWERLGQDVRQVGLVAKAERRGLIQQYFNLIYKFTLSCYLQVTILKHIC